MIATAPHTSAVLSCNQPKCLLNDKDLQKGHMLSSKLSGQSIQVLRDTCNLYTAVVAMFLLATAPMATTAQAGARATVMYCDCMTSRLLQQHA